MKKISIFLLAAMAMISCGNSYKAQDAKLTNENDSLNYALGLVTGLQIKQSYLANDSSDATVAEFIDALDKAYQGSEEELDEIEKAGRQVGASIKGFEKNGLADHPKWVLNEKLLLQGLVNGLFEDTTVLTAEVADDFIMNCYRTQREMPEAKVIYAKCPSKAKSVTLENALDSLNYSYGFMHGLRTRTYLLAADTTDDGFELFIDNINKGLKEDVRNPQLVMAAKNIGNVIRTQEPIGLMNIAGVETNYDLIKQGFINGMYNYTEQMDAPSADQFIRVTLSRIEAENAQEEAAKAEEMGAQAKAEGEQFLAENALRDGVKVTESGLQYEVLLLGNGAKPTAEQTVKVHYEGTLIDGTVFDSSYERGVPAEFPLNGVIKGWTEGLQLMPVGSKFRFFIPYQLAYGERGAGQSIPPYSALVFTVELLDIK